MQAAILPGFNPILWALLCKLGMGLKF